MNMGTLCLWSLTHPRIQESLNTSEDILCGRHWARKKMTEGADPSPGGAETSHPWHSKEASPSTTHSEFELAAALFSNPNSAVPAV